MAAKLKITVQTQHFSNVFIIYFKMILIISISFLARYYATPLWKLNSIEPPLDEAIEFLESF